MDDRELLVPVKRHLLITGMVFVITWTKSPLSLVLIGSTNLN